MVKAKERECGDASSNVVANRMGIAGQMAERGMDQALSSQSGRTEYSSAQVLVDET